CAGYSNYRLDYW
nr:immunoglobulin heavy chain junction region [Macaca mulatta]